MARPLAEVHREIDALIEAQRALCLWSLPVDDWPRTDAERRLVLEAIRRRGDLAAYQRAAELERWLSQSSSEASASSA